jgi:hypothetical protein
MRALQASSPQGRKELDECAMRDRWKTKQRLNADEIAKVVTWLMDDELLDGSKNGPVTEHGTRYRLMNNFNYYYVKKLNQKVELTSDSRDRVQKAVRARIDEKYGIEWKGNS